MFSLQDVRTTLNICRLCLFDRIAMGPNPLTARRQNWAQEETKEGRGWREEARPRKEDGKGKRVDGKDEGKERKNLLVRTPSKEKSKDAIGNYSKDSGANRTNGKNELKVPADNLTMTPVRGQNTKIKLRTKPKAKALTKKKNLDEKPVVKVTVGEESVSNDESAANEPEPKREIEFEPFLAGCKPNNIDAFCNELIRLDPERDCRRYNVKNRANELFDALDTDENGWVDQDEFVEGKVEERIKVDNIFQVA